MNTRYSYGWADHRELFGITAPGGVNNDINLKYTGKESVDKGWACSYCRSLFTDQRVSCPNCGAPK
jgi:hypothetical protein